MSPTVKLAADAEVVSGVGPTGASLAGPAGAAAGGGGPAAGGVWPELWAAPPGAGCANAGAQHASSASAHRASGTFPREYTSAKLARNVVVQRNTHQDDEQSDPHLLPKGLGTLGKRAAFQPLHQLKEDLAAVEDRDRQQVEDPERQRDEHQEAQERRRTGGGRLAGELRDRQRAAQVLQRHAPEHHAPEQPRLQHAHAPGFAPR